MHETKKCNHNRKHEWKKYCKTKVDSATVGEPAWQQNGHTITKYVKEQHPWIKCCNHSHSSNEAYQVRGRLQETFHQSIWNNHIVLSMKQRNAITTGNMDRRNIAKPKLIEQQLVTPLASEWTHHYTAGHKQHPLNKVLKLFIVTQSRPAVKHIWWQDTSCPSSNRLIRKSL